MLRLLRSSHLHRMERFQRCARMLVVAVLASAVLSVAGVHSSGAVEPEEILSNPALEKRARTLSAELRCLVCQNQSIDESNAPLAKDLRLLVRERLTAGDTDSEILDYVVARYGEFVLLRPRFSGSTLVLWLSPVLLLALGIWLARGVMRKQASNGAGTVDQLSAEEAQRLAEILKDKTERG